MNRQPCEPGASRITPAAWTGRRPLLVEGAAASPGRLPSARDLLHSMRDDAAPRIGDAAEHPLAHWGHLLAEMHRARLTGDTGKVTGYARATLIHDIDVWTEQHIPQHRHGVALHTETLGSVIDHLAETQVRATIALTSTEGSAEPRVHAAWHRLAELADGYNDLIAQVTDGVRRLPVPREADW